MESDIKCLNCNTTLKGEYCHNCGQSAAVSRITFRDTLEGFLSSTFSLEGNLPRTIHALLINPGKLFRDFLSGKRKPYYKPVAFFVVTTAIYIILRSLIGYDPLEGTENIEQESRPGGELFSKAARFMVDNINNIMFTLVFAIGLMLKLFFRKKYHLAEYTTIAFYIAGIYILFGTLFMIFSQYSGFRDNQYQMLFLFVYIIYCIRSLFQTDKFGKWLKYISSAFLSIIIYVVFGYGISLLIVWIKEL